MTGEDGISAGGGVAFESSAADDQRHGCADCLKDKALIGVVPLIFCFNREQPLKGDDIQPFVKEVPMKKVFVLTVLFVFLMAIAAFAAGPKTYQVTGPVLEVTDTMIAVQKGKDRWEIARDASTKIAGDIQVGQKVTIEYTMTATKVELKETKSKSKSKSK